MTHTNRHPSEWGFTDWITEARARLDEAEQTHARMVAGERVHRADFSPPRNGAVGAIGAAIRHAVRDWDHLNTDIPDAGAISPKKRKKTPKPPVQGALFDAPDA
ncbi:hypothetical protein [Nocardiopsis synnemataformans]|uniref:hypothetical protein n=1 Tax=Nocardiopsis synnemataformans TaxID=61305 RepID=UPI003EBBD024